MKMHSVGQVLCFSLVLCSCGAPPHESPPADSPFSRAITGAAAGHLAGTVGHEHIDGPTHSLAVFSDSDETAVVGVVELPEHAVLVQLSVTNAEPLLVPGVDIRATGADLHRIRMLGCVGQAPGTYDEFEGVADEVALVVEDAPDGALGDVLVTAVGRWVNANDSAANAVLARFTLLRGEP